MTNQPLSPGEPQSIAEAAGQGYHATGSPVEDRTGRSIGEILGAVTRDVSTLMRQEVALAKAELSQSTSRAGKGVGLFAGAAVAGLLFLVFLSVSAWWGLGKHVGNDWSGLIVAAVWVIVAIILALAGRKELERIRGLRRTTETLSKVPNALKGNEEANR